MDDNKDKNGWNKKIWGHYFATGWGEREEIWGQFHQCSTSSFYARRSQKCKKLLDLTVFFALLGSASVKAARRMLMKLTPGQGNGQKLSEQKLSEVCYTNSVKGTSINDVTALEEGCQAFCDDSEQALVLKSVIMRSSGQKIWKLRYVHSWTTPCIVTILVDWRMKRGRGSIT